MRTIITIFIILWVVAGYAFAAAAKKFKNQEKNQKLW